MSTTISQFDDISGIGSGFETGTVCGSASVGERHGTPKCFSILAFGGRAKPIVMPKQQALAVAGQIADQFGFKLIAK
jgi:hypothetical protein